MAKEDENFNEAPPALFCTIKGMGIAPITPPEILAGRLAYYFSNWVRITKDCWVLDTVQGYRMKLLATPYQTSKPHTPQYNATQSQLKVGELLQKGAVAEVDPQGGFYSTLFLVPKKDGRQRPVISLKALKYFNTSRWKGSTQ